MKACVLNAINDLQYQDTPFPILKEDEVLVKIMASGICGSDVARVFTKGTYHFPTIPGHEFAGQIKKVSDNIDKELIGKKVAVFPLIPCFECDNCQIGQYAQCSSYDYYGSRCDGGFAEYIAVKIWNLLIVPDELSYEEAAMCEPTAVALHGLTQIDIKFMDNVAIVGAGTIGLLMAQILKANGANNIFIIDINNDKLKFAKDLGYTHYINPLKTNIEEYIKSYTQDKGSDVTLECAGVSATIQMALNITKSFGQVLCLGNPAGDIKLAQNAYWQILRKQLTLKGTWNSEYSNFRNDWRNAINAMATKKIDVSKLITHRYSMSQCKEAFDIMRNQDEFKIKIMFINN